jgi:hypothetical protein
MKVISRHVYLHAFVAKKFNFQFLINKIKRAKRMRNELEEKNLMLF